MSDSVFLSIFVVRTNLLQLIIGMIKLPFPYALSFVINSNVFNCSIGIKFFPWSVFYTRFIHNSFAQYDTRFKNITVMFIYLVPFYVLLQLFARGAPRDGAARILHFVHGRTKAQRGDGEAFVDELLRRQMRRAAEHDRHAAADGQLPGRLDSESGRTIRIRSGSSSSISPITVEASVSCPCPDDVVWMVAVIAPSASTLMRQDSIQVVVLFLSLSSGSNEELPPDGSRHAATPMPASIPWRAGWSRSASSAS